MVSGEWGEDGNGGQGKSGTEVLAEVVTALVTVLYIWYSWQETSGARTPPKAWLSHHCGRLAEKATAVMWDTTLKLRRYYRREVEGKN